MAKYTRTDLKPGLRILVDGAPHEVLDAESTKPGKGQAFTRLKLRHLLTGRVNDKTIKSSEAFDAADVQEKNLQYLYRDADGGVFMEPDTYEQHTVRADAMEEAERWLQPQDTCQALIYNGAPVRITAPAFVELEVAATEPGVRGDTATGATKPATLSTGTVVRVPLFIETGEVVRVDTRSGEYTGRA